MQSNKMNPNVRSQAMDYKVAGDQAVLDQEYEQAIVKYTQALKLSTFNEIFRERVYISRGLAYANLGKFDAAISNYNEALNEIKKRLNENATEILFHTINKGAAYKNRGDIYISQGKFDKAISDFNKALELDPSNEFAIYNSRGFAYTCQRKFAEGISDYMKALAIDSNDKETCENLENLFLSIREGDFDALSKSYLLDIIKRLSSKEMQISLLLASRDKSTALGSRFWKQEGLFACREDCGALKEICSLLIKLRPDLESKVKNSKLNKGQEQASANSSLLFYYKAKNPKHSTVENKIFFEDTIFQL